MNQQEAQAIITNIIKSDPERIINLVLQVSPSTGCIIDATRKAPGSLQGVAAAALKDALRGKDNAETIANMIAFAKRLA